MSKTNQILIALWLVIASFVAYLALGLVTSRQSAERRVGEQASSYARLVEQHASASLDRANAGLIEVMDRLRPSDLIGSQPLVEARRLEIEALLRIQQQRTPGVIAMPLANANGDIIAHSLGTPAAANLGDREYFQVLKHEPRTAAAVSAVAYGRVSNKPGVQIVRRIDLPDGSFGGTVGANLGLAENFSDFYATLALGKNSAVSLRDASNKLLVRYPVVEAKLGKQIAASGLINERILAGDAEGLIVTASAIDNIDRAFAFRRLAGYPIYAAVGLSLEDALASWRSERNRVALGAMLIILAGLGITVMLRRQERAENQLLETQMLLDEVEHLSKLGGWKYDRATRAMTWTDEVYRIYGVGKDYDPANIERDISFFSPEDGETISKTFAKAVKEGEPYDLELRFVRKGGERIWVRTTGTPLVENGRVVSVTGNIVDITERKTAEEELKKSIAFRDLLSEAMPLPVFYRDTEGRYTGCNSAFERVLGRSKKEIIGKTSFDLSPPDLAKIYRERDLGLLADPDGMQTYETQLFHADGTAHDVILHKARITDAAGNATGILGVITDITDLKRIQAKHDQLEAQLRQSQKMEALGTLAGGVAHDFNNIVAAIMGNVELAREDVGPGHAALVSLEEIRKASRRAKNLVQQILAFSRRQQSSREVISLAPVVEESLALLRTTLPAGVNLTLECAADAPAVLADATQIEQVLLNLCGNAWQSMQAQERPGLIEVRLQAHQRFAGQAREAGVAVATDELRPGRYACLTVQDNGSGMDKDTLARIFEPFFTTKAVGKGTGLGLAVVHGIVHEHGASIEVESVPGEGSIFRVYFPAVQAPGEVVRTRTARAAPTHGQGKRVLYVDDDESMVFLMTRLLERRGYRVSGYTDPHEAVAAVRAAPEAFDLAVTDYNMPAMSGLEVARAMREIRADLPVALASGYITDELRREAPSAGVSELIYKPNTADDLCEAVARLASTPGRNAISA